MAVLGGGGLHLVDRLYLAYLGDMLASLKGKRVGQP